MPDGALQLLGIGLLALLYLFFLRALRAVWVQTRAPAPAPVAPPRQASAALAAQASTRGRRGRRPRTPTLVVVEPPTERGRRHAIDGEVTIGRAAGCGLVVDDGYTSQLHARVFRDGPNLLVEDLGSTNGTWVGAEQVTGPRMLRRGEHLRVGQRVYEVEA